MQNFFTLFSFPQSFEIDPLELEQKYLEIQNQFHPDKSDVAEVEKSMLANEGYKILSDDFLRLCHLLELKGIEIIDERNAIKPGITTLEKILELQEEIAEIKNKAGASELKKEIEVEISSLMPHAVKLFKEEKPTQAAQILIEIKYLKKCLADIKKIGK
jgi:molecular chaperone HscB